MRASPVSSGSPRKRTQGTHKGNSRVKKGEIRQRVGFQGWAVDGRRPTPMTSASAHIAVVLKRTTPQTSAAVLLKPQSKNWMKQKKDFYYHLKSGKMEKRWKIWPKPSFHKEYSELYVRTVKINLYMYIQMYKSCSFCPTVSVLMFPSCVPPPNNISFKGTARGKKKPFWLLHSFPLRLPSALLSPHKKKTPHHQAT